MPRNPGSGGSWLSSDEGSSLGFSLHQVELSGSHRSTHIASDLASRVLASQAKPQRESESQAFRIARSLKTPRFFASQANIAEVSQAFFLAFSCDFRSSECVFPSLAKTIFRIASDLGMCDSNRIAHRGCIARFGPLRSRDWQAAATHK